MSRLSTLLVAIIIVFATTNASATVLSATPLVEISPGVGTVGAAPDQTAGWDFVTGIAPIEVTDLGVYDWLEDGLGESHQVGVWRVSDGALLTSTTVPSGTGATLIDGFRYVPTTPVVLAPNTRYVIGAEHLTNTDVFWTQQTVTMNLNATFGEALGSSTGGGFTQPTIVLNPTFAEGYFGPNLLAVVPEPSTTMLAMLGAIGIGYFWRKPI